MNIGTLLQSLEAKNTCCFVQIGKSKVDGGCSVDMMGLLFADLLDVKQENSILILNGNSDCFFLNSRRKIPLESRLMKITEYFGSIGYVERGKEISGGSLSH